MEPPFLIIKSLKFIVPSKVLLLVIVQVVVCVPSSQTGSVITNPVRKSFITLPVAILEGCLTRFVFGVDPPEVEAITSNSSSKTIPSDKVLLTFTSAGY